MDQKRILYTFGSLTSFQSHTLSDFSQQKTQVPNLAYQPTLHNISTTQPIAKSDLQVYPFKSASGTQPCLKKYKIIKKPAKGKEVCAAGGNCAKQTVLYKFLKRRLYASQVTPFYPIILLLWFLSFLSSLFRTNSKLAEKTKQVLI